MVQLTEVIEEKQRVLIVSKKIKTFTNDLKKELLHYGAEVFISPHIPQALDNFDICFIIDDFSVIDRLDSISFKKIVFFAIGNKLSSSSRQKILRHKTVKLIHVIGNRIEKNDFDRILWFIYSQSRESELTIHVSKDMPTHTPVPPQVKEPRIVIPTHLLTVKRFVVLIIATTILVHLAFLPHLLLSSFSFYQSFIFLKSEQIEAAQAKNKEGKATLEFSKKLYNLVRPTYLLFSLALPIDSIYDVNDSVSIVITTSSDLYGNGKSTLQSILKKNKTPEEISSIAPRFKRIEKQVDILSDNLLILNQNLPFPDLKQVKKIKADMLKASDGLSKIKKLLPFAAEFLGSTERKKYLLLFANNMELRPGGGFIGSYGILETHDYTIDDIKIYDVYDADGQLKTHVDPPEPIRIYLHQPHYFLRDSAFSPDFIENTKEAYGFLEKELNIRDFDGTILLTTSAIQNIIGAFDSIYLPDFNETVNQDNFYLKAQIHSEKDFFPGSIQKKNFLGTLSRYIFLHLENVSPKQLAQKLQLSLDEKQIVVSSKNPTLQNMLDQLYWSGRIITPQCTIQENCTSDYLFTYDANLGVNKANFYVKHDTSLSTEIKNDLSIYHTLTLNYRNESVGEVFPGGTYKNYLQILVPADAQIQQVTKNDTLVESLDESTDAVKKLGFYFEIPPQKNVEIRITYSLAKKMEKGKHLYQLVVQKQTGSANSGLNLSFGTNKNTTILNQNFSPLVKDGQFVYNTVLNNDKIFFIDLVNQ